MKPKWEYHADIKCYDFAITEYIRLSVFQLATDKWSFSIDDYSRSSFLDIVFPYEYSRSNDCKKGALRFFKRLVKQLEGAK